MTSSSSNASSSDFETHNYPSNKKITYKTPNNSFVYNIINEGIYPDVPKYTQANSNGCKYPIPDEPVYCLNWNDSENENHQVTSEKSATDATQKYLKEIDKKTTRMSGVLLFGFQLQCVHNRRINKQKRNTIIPFEEVKDSTHRSHDFNESSDSILNSNSSELIGITLKINDQLYYLCFKEDDDGKKLYAEAVVQQLDQHNISQKWIS
ncbi:7215_t:CDS:2 [Entrophospora sp. SA101]|nr:7215_t:CDS:2 [Entrophospora sp. SA101]